jgi:hypothetical protein
VAGPTVIKQLGDVKCEIRGRTLKKVEIAVLWGWIAFSFLSIIMT